MKDAWFTRTWPPLRANFSSLLFCCGDWNLILSLVLPIWRPKLVKLANLASNMLNGFPGGCLERSRKGDFNELWQVRIECACRCLRETPVSIRGLLTELLISHFFSRLYGFLRVQDPIGDPCLPDLTHKSLLLKVRIKFGNLELVVFYAKFVNSMLSCTVTSPGA